MPETRCRPGVDDGSPLALRDHMRCSEADRCRIGLQRDIDDRVPILLGHLVDAMRPDYPCIVDQDVDATEAGDRRLDDRFAAGPTRRAGIARNRFSAGITNLLRDLLGAAYVADEYLGPFPRQSEGFGSTDVATSAGDDRHLAGQSAAL